VTREPLHLTLLRHGRSNADDGGVCGGRYDDPLTNEGIEQAEKLAVYWQKHSPGFEHIVCSSLQRAKQTAEIIAEMLGMNVEISDLWMERDNGPLAGMPFEEANRLYPNRNLRGRYEPYVPDGGESYMAMMRRAQRGIEKLVQSNHTNVLVIAHGGVLNAALQDILGTSRATFSFGDTGFAQVTLYRDKDEARLLGVGLQPHFLPSK
jgi:2,3-bisphosphoglycerate-dependent phosphoglycerate mutase